MDRKRQKFLLLGLGIVISMTFLLVVAMNQEGGMAYYLTVSEFVQSPDRAAGDFRVSGKVSPGSIVRLPTGQDVTFTMTDGQSELPVAYHGVVPDAFVDDADVVVEGQLRPDGTLEANMLLAKCPSKYEAADGEYTREHHPDEIPLN
jgi:cytochrome c-type biogenesis protein CcmE